MKFGASIASRPEPRSAASRTHASLRSGGSRIPERAHAIWHVGVRQPGSDPDRQCAFRLGACVQAQGDPGQHNDTIVTAASGTGYGGPMQNQADMVTGAYKRKSHDNLTWYTAVAATFNGPSATTILVPADAG